MSTMDKVKNALHINKDHTPATNHTTADHTIGSGNTTAGHTTAGHTTAGHTHTSGTAEGVAGPHSSRVANAADPRVDSDMDGSRNTHAATGTTTTGNTTVGHGHTTTGTGVTGSGVAGAGAGAGYSGSTNAGPHDSNMANKMDPRVDSDMDGSRNAGLAQGTTGATGSGIGSSGYNGTHTGTTGTTGATGTGIGSSGYSGTHTGNHTGTHTGTHGGISNSTNAGPHNSNLANKADPRVDSDLDGRGNRHGAATGGIMGASGSHATPGSGTAQNTAGPHNSDTLNKLDPRVDSDRDGSKTYGGNKTHA